MKNISKTWIILGVLALIVIWAVSIYNGIIRLEENVNSQWANVESVYQRRADLIPNLVNTVKGYAEHEQETLQGVVDARSKVGSVTLKADELTPENIQKFQEAQSQFSSALSRLMVVVEKYPDLKANQNFLELQAQLEGTENRISVERMKFNDMVKAFNQKVRRFPANLLNAMFGFEQKGYFEAESGAEKAPEVKF
jgi:LemA protein